MFMARSAVTPGSILKAGIAVLVFSACLAACGSGSGTAVAATPGPDAKASYLPASTPQLRLERSGHQIMVTVLAEDLVHVAYGDRIEAGPPYFSPMVAKRSFPDAVSHTWDEASQKLSTASMTVELDQGCWRISDIASTPARTLTRLCVDDWSAGALKLKLSAEGNTEVLGLGQMLSSSRDNPSWLGQQRSPGETFGNAMTYSDISASGNTQVPVAYVLGKDRNNYGLFFDTPYPLDFNFSGSNWSVNSTSSSLGLFVFSGADLKSLRHRYLALTGTPPVPPLKAFGLWISEFGYDSWSELDDKLASLRQADFPIDGAVLDLQWFGGIKTGSETTSMGKLSWDTMAFPEPAKKIAQHAADGLGVMLIEESYIGAGLAEHRELAAHRYLAMACPPPCTTPVRLDTNPWWGVGGMIDWSNAEGAAWWHDSKRAPLIDDGVLGHWTDLGEPEAYKSSALYAGYDWHGARVTRHRDIHNLYNFFWSESIASGTARSHPDRRTWILSRSGTAGSQRFGVGMWSGDVGSTFATLRAQMAAQANMSLSGFDYYGSDIGGFHREGFGASLNTLYTRWLVTSALLDVPVRPHTENLCNCKETAPDRIGDRASNLAALKLRYQLTPYLYSLAHEAHASGEPIFPPLVYHFQTDARARAVATTKMIGPWLLFGTPVTSGDTLQTYLPQGTWTDFRHPAVRTESSGVSLTQNVTEDGVVRAPLYLREGAIVPILRQAPRHLGNPASGAIQWFSDLVIRTVPVAAESRFVLVEDDGVSRGYEAGRVARTTLLARQATPGSFSIGIRPDNKTGASASRTLAVEVVTGKNPVGTVALNGKPLAAVAAGSSEPGWYQADGVVTVQLGSRSVDEAIELSLAP